MNLWTLEDEIYFFNFLLKHNIEPEKLFYKVNDIFYAYIPRNLEGDFGTLQSRNSFIGEFTENFCLKLLSPIAEEQKLYAVKNVKCKELSLDNTSGADIAFCTTPDDIQTPANIKLIFEVKMSIVNNYTYINDNIQYISDFTKHKGRPSLLRSDSMLKAIGKAVNIRLSSKESSNIPIVILGNSPISQNYLHKADILRTRGIIQHFINLYPSEENKRYCFSSPKEGFLTLSNMQQLKELIVKLLNMNSAYFSSMISLEELGKIIKLASFENNNILIAAKFLDLIENINETE